MRRLRRTPAPVEVARGERVLAWAPAVDGQVVAGTRDALYVGGTRLPWEQVEAADWDRDESRLRVSEVGRWGEPRAEHVLVLDEATPAADRLLQLVRERITASVVLVRHVPVTGRAGVRVVARRAPAGTSAISWIYEYDAGVDPEDPLVRAAAATALDAARADLGEL